MYGQGFPAHKATVVAAYRDRCQKIRETRATHMTSFKRELMLN